MFCLLLYRGLGTYVESYVDVVCLILGPTLNSYASTILTLLTCFLALMSLDLLLLFLFKQPLGHFFFRMTGKSRPLLSEPYTLVR